jgi:hypothetical protein
MSKEHPKKLWGNDLAKLTIQLVAVAVTLFVIILIIAISRFLKVADQSLLNNQPDPTPVVATSSTIPNTNWKTFVSQDMGIQFQYPENLLAYTDRPNTISVVLRSTGESEKRFSISKYKPNDDLFSTYNTLYQTPIGKRYSNAKTGPVGDYLRLDDQTFGGRRGEIFETNTAWELTPPVRRILFSVHNAYIEVSMEYSNPTPNPSDPASQIDYVATFNTMLNSLKFF